MVGVHPKIIKSIFALLIFTGSTSALTNYINVAGELRDGSGNLLNGNYDIIFKIYNASSGGTLLWNESYTGNNSVTVENGYFSVALGSNNTLNLSFDENYYLSVEIGTQGQLSSQLQSGKSTADYELPERYALGTAGYSFNSRQAGRFMCPTNMI